MNKIVCATDFTRNSIAALQYAFKMSNLLKKELIVLNICNPEEDDEYHSASDNQAILDTRVQLLQEYCSIHLKANFDSLQIRAIIKKGKNIPKKICNFIKDLDIAFLIMGTHGNSPFKAKNFGSITNAMIAASTFPILAIPPTFEFINLETIVYTSDFEEDDIYNLNQIVKIFAPLKISIVILHIYAYEEYLTKERLIGFQTLLAEKVALDNFEFKLIFSENILKTLNEYLLTTNTDMVAMMERKNKSEFNAGSHQDLVKKMDNITSIPLLSFNTVY
ncbi:Nucleotide-binding universal stress protein, UspA family [Gillisia sp. Hel1_33_143]|uniref:universal stress protein n=1 Tax=Gillisia sp. Hel1_33_143 TaxID=1336796 RepID=UPI00087A54E2|nr:universal stress protein [Gillisia sp. Hel1_33_143]SDS77664.1 Nucleotide-binding universal stress protein, UspA family [Gillisia sp. Hel1_33_143]